MPKILKKNPHLEKILSQIKELELTLNLGEKLTEKEISLIEDALIQIIRNIQN